MKSNFYQQVSRSIVRITVKNLSAFRPFRQRFAPFLLKICAFWSKVHPSRKSLFQALVRTYLQKMPIFALRQPRKFLQFPKWNQNKVLHNDDDDDDDDEQCFIQKYVHMLSRMFFFSRYHPNNYFQSHTNFDDLTAINIF